MFVGGKWYKVSVPKHLAAADDPYGGLDVVLLNNLILGPILGINDPRTSERLEYIPGTVPLEYIVDQGRCGAFFVVPAGGHRAGRPFACRRGAWGMPWISVCRV